ncbi:MAG: hypothetical protein SGPRY_008438 [Prymnesium sp.]
MHAVCDTSPLEDELASELSLLLRESGPLELRDVVRRNPELRPKLTASHLRWLPLTYLYPAHFATSVCSCRSALDPSSLGEGEEEAGSPAPPVSDGVLRVVCAPRDGCGDGMGGEGGGGGQGWASTPHAERRLATRGEVEAALEARLLKALRGFVTREAGGSPTAPVPLPWLMRGIAAEVELLFAVGGPSAPMLHTLPGISLLPPRRRQHAWYETCVRQLCAFVQSRPALVVWHHGPGGEEGRACKHHGGVCTACGASVSLTPAGAAGISLPARAEGARRAKRQMAASEEEEAALCTEALVGACAAGGELIVLLAASRTARMFVAEFSSACEVSGVTTEMVVRLGEGVYLLPPPSTPAAAHAYAALRCLLPSLASVRLHVTLLCASNEIDDIAAAARRLEEGQRMGGWSVTYELNYPAADHAQLPFHQLVDAPRLLLALYEALGPPSSAEQAGHHLLILEMKTAFLLCSLPSTSLAQLPPRAAPLGIQAAGSADVCDAEGRAELSRLGPTQANTMPWWVSPWEARPFSFSASLDPLVALAAINLAALEATRGVTASSYPRPNLRLFDPCCGSATILAAALALGFTLVGGSELRAEFIAGATENLQWVGLSAPIHQHDATEPFPPELLAVEGTTTLVVSNPPWGKKFGTVDDGARIVKSVASQFTATIMCWLVNSNALETLREMPGITILRHVRLGGVEVVLAKSAGK